MSGSNAPTPATYGYTGSLGIGALNFNSGFALPYTIFTPVEWAPQNTQGVTLPTNSGSYQGAYQTGTGITPDLLAAAQDNLAGISYTGLSSVSYSGMSSQGLIGSLFTSWGNTLAQIAQQNANSFSQAVANGAKACSGFFSCLFG